LIRSSSTLSLTPHNHSNVALINHKKSSPQHTAYNDVITKDERYIGNIKIYNTGIMEDPVPGEKRGKGVQALNSSYWIRDLSIFVARKLPQLKSILAFCEN
jgi:hypothetical protein